MRLPFPTLILSVTALFILSPSLVSSIHPYALSRREHSLSSSAYVLSSRQHRVARDLLDVCINANVNLATDAPQLLGLGSLLGDLDLGTDDKLCLCLKDLNLYLDTNDNIQALVGLLGKNAVSTLITALINTSPNSKQCTFPSNAHHTCNNSDPCHYECDMGYVQNGDACVCALPNISCNGVCGSFPQGCGSARPKDRRSEPVYTLSQAQRRCQSRESVCGIPGKLGTLAFECIDTKITKDSCGGCVAPHSFLDKSPQVLGKDCTSISHVLSSSCVESQCIINSCTDGFVPSLSKDICIPSPGSLTKMRRMRRRDVQSSNPIIPTTVHAPVAESDNPIVVGLSDLLSGLQLLGPVKSNATVDGLGSGLSDTVNPLLNGVNIGPNNAKRRATSETVNSTISSELRSQMEGLFDLVLALEDSMSLLPPPGSDATASLDDQSELGVARAMGQLLQSKTTAALLSNIDAFINAVSTLQSQFNSCGCVETLGLDRASNILGLIAESADGMKNWCAENSIVPPTPADPSPTSLGPLLPTGNVSPQAPPTRGPGTAAKSGDVPIFIGLDNLLQELGLGSTGIITADGLGDGMDSTVNNLLDSLAGIGPSGVRARQDLMREHKGGARGSHILSARQLAAAATASVESDLLGEVIALVDSVLGLKNISRSLLSALPALTPSNDNPPALISSSKPTGTEVPALPPPNSASVLGSNLVDSILQATLGLLTAQTYTSAVGESEALVSQSISSLEALTSCNCIEELGLGGTYEYLSGILDAALALQDLLQKTSGVLTPTTSSGPIAVGGASMIPATYSTRSTARSAPTGSPSTGLAGTPPSTDDSASSTGDKPLIVGLTKLLNGLGVNITANVVVDNLLGDDLDHSLNSLLNGMGIGPNGVAA